MALFRVSGQAVTRSDLPAASVERYSGVEPMQLAGAALLRLAWQDRDRLLA